MEKVSPIKKSEGKFTLSEPYKHAGLCSCCNGASTCTYPKIPGRSILECEEFDGILPDPTGGVDVKNVSPLSLVDPSISSETGPHEYRGLCSNCEERTTCTYPKPEGGVWHCDEYR